MTLGALTILIEQVKQCEDIPFPKFENCITEVESDEEQQLRPKANQSMVRVGQKTGREGNIKIVLDMNVKHPASISIIPQQTDRAGSLYSPPPWMLKPVDISVANIGKLILPFSKKNENIRTERKQDTKSYQDVHWPSKDLYKKYFASQLKGKM